MKKIGKIGRINLEANKILKKIYVEKGILTCELKLSGCWKDNALGFAHREKRWKYIKNPEKLSEFKETLLACNPCHDKIEHNKNLTEEFFKRLRKNIIKK